MIFQERRYSSCGPSVVYTHRLQTKLPEYHTYYLSLSTCIRGNRIVMIVAANLSVFRYIRGCWITSPSFDDTDLILEARLNSTNLQPFVLTRRTMYLQFEV